MLAVAALFSSLPGAGAGAATKSKTPTPLQATKSFEFTFAVDASGGGTGATAKLSLDTSGAYKAPSSQDCAAEAALGLLTISQQYVSIGKKVWVDEGSGYRPAKKSDLDFAGFCPSDPSFWADFALTIPGSATGTRETKNGIDSDNLDLTAALDDLTGLGIFDDDLPADLTIQTFEAWRARKGGYIVAVNLGVTATTDATCAAALEDAVPVPLTAPCTFDVSYELSDVNAKSVTVTAPKVKK